MSISLWVGCSSCGRVKENQPLTTKQSLQGTENSASFMLTASLFSFFSIFSPKKARVFWVVCLSLCRHFAQSFLPRWDPADLGGGGVVTQMSPSASWTRHLLFPSIPALQHSNRRRYKSLSVIIHLLMPHFKVVGGFVPITFKEVVDLSAAVWTIRIRS